MFCWHGSQHPFLGNLSVYYGVENAQKAIVWHGSVVGRTSHRQKVRFARRRRQGVSSVLSSTAFVLIGQLTALFLSHMPGSLESPRPMSRNHSFSRFAEMIFFHWLLDSFTNGVSSPGTLCNWYHASEVSSGKNSLSVMSSPLIAWRLSLRSPL